MNETSPPPSNQESDLQRLLELLRSHPWLTTVVGLFVITSIMVLSGMYVGTAGVSFFLACLATGLVWCISRIIISFEPNTPRNSDGNLGMIAGWLLVFALILFRSCISEHTAPPSFPEPQENSQSDDEVVPIHARG